MCFAFSFCRRLLPLRLLRLGRRAAIAPRAAFSFIAFLPFYHYKMFGLVVKNTGSWYTVKTDDGRLVNSKIKGNFRLKGIRSTNPVAVGDRVEIAVNAEGTAFITEIADRRNYIIRKSSNLSKQSHIIAANVDMALLVVTVNYPQTSTTFIDRFLASAEAYRVPVVLVFNKDRKSVV